MKISPRKRPQPSPVIFDKKHNQKLNRLDGIKYVDPSKIKQRENNPRQHSDEQIARISASISQFGFSSPILVDDDYVVIAGEARLLAARSIGLEDVPVIVISHLSEAEIRAYRIADNKLAEMGTWSKDALLIEFDTIMAASEFSVELTGFATAEIDAMQIEFGEEDDSADTLPTPSPHPVSKLGDIWVLGNHRLMCGSSLDTENWKDLLGDELAKCVFTDPPYNVKIDGNVSGLGKHKHREFAMASGEMNEDQFIAFNHQYLEAILSHIEEGSILAICMDWRHLFELQSAIRATCLKQLNLCIWNKRNGGMGSLYRSQHELVVVAKKGLARHINNVQLGKFGRYRTNVWDYAGVNSFSASRDANLTDHPTVKPIGLVADYIRDVTDHGDLVLDAFIGSGTTILAAERTGRRAAGMDIDPAYIDVAIRRWQEMTGKPASLSDSGETFDSVAKERELKATSTPDAAE